MNNKFLSRGKREDNGKWVKGYLIEQDDPEYHAYICMSGFKAEVDNRHQDILECDLEEIIPETAGRCVGLTDKNNTMMFEGDIVKNNTDRLGVVTFGEYCDLFHSLETHLGFFIKWNIESYYRQDIGFWKQFIEVVGNIHDNKQMLERADMPVSNDVFQPVLKSATHENFEIMNA